MKDEPKNVAQSVRDRLRTVTVRLRLDYNLVLTRYVLERLLYRLSVSPHRDRFALKGAMLFVVWTANIIRPTQDLDLLGLGNSDLDALREAFREIMSTPVTDDGVTFDLDSVRAEPIRADQLYDGVRVSALAFTGTARVSFTRPRLRPRIASRMVVIVRTPSGMATACVDLPFFVSFRQTANWMRGGCLHMNAMRPAALMSADHGHGFAFRHASSRWICVARAERFKLLSFGPRAIKWLAFPAERPKLNT